MGEIDHPVGRNGRLIGRYKWNTWAQKYTWTQQCTMKLSMHMQQENNNLWGAQVVPHNQCRTVRLAQDWDGSKQMSRKISYAIWQLLYNFLCGCKQAVFVRQNKMVHRHNATYNALPELGMCTQILIVLNLFPSLSSETFIMEIYFNEHRLNSVEYLNQVGFSNRPSCSRWASPAIKVCIYLFLDGQFPNTPESMLYMKPCWGHMLPNCLRKYITQLYEEVMKVPQLIFLTK